MPTEIVLLCDATDAKDLAAFLLEANPKLKITHVETKTALVEHCETPKQGQRLVAFCTSVIVPKAVLIALNGDAYNFHPGPPTYPGLYPACFAVYAGATQFGAICHTLTESIDDGPIVGVNSVDISPDINRLDLEALSRQLITRLFTKMAPALATVEGPLPELDLTWSGKPTRQKDFDALCRLPSDVSKDEFDRRYRAVWEGPFHGLTIELFGRTFRLESKQKDDVVYKGGRPVTK
jgi:methionyl-tRNA formyltransferase